MISRAAPVVVPVPPLEGAPAQEKDRFPPEDRGLDPRSMHQTTLSDQAPVKYELKKHAAATRTLRALGESMETRANTQDEPGWNWPRLVQNSPFH